MLYLIGLGLWDIKDMSLKAYDIMRSCEKVYLENYTSNTGITSKKLSKLLYKDVIDLDREKVENFDWLLDEAKEKNVVLAIKGDVFSATTHYTLYDEAKRKGVSVKVIHGSSIFTAIGKLGLSLYKFGRVVSLPHPSLFPSYPQSPFEYIKKNKECGLHTLVLLDIGMSLREGMELIYEYLGNEEIIGCCCLGSENEIIVKGKVNELLDSKELNNKYASCIMLPSRREFYEHVQV